MTQKGGTPYIHTACQKGLVNLVRALVQKHGTGILKDVNRRGYTPLDVALSNNKQEVAVVLINEFRCDTKGGTPYIHTACKNGWVKLVQALVQKHGTGILNNKGSMTYCGLKATTTSLHDILANRQGHEVAEMLSKEFGSSVKDLEGQSLLHLACKQGDVRLVRSLMLDGNVTARDNQGLSLLHIACKLGDVSLVRTLMLDGKADTTARDNEGNTPFDMAVGNSREEVALVLMNEFHCDTKGGYTLHTHSM